MKQLVILCDLSSEKFSNFISAEMAGLFEKYKLEYEIRDLYKSGFNPILGIEDITAASNGTASNDVLEEQKYISDADYIVLVHPIGWSGMPAMLKGYIDRVFSEGFAYNITKKGVKKLLSDKKMIIINTFSHASNFFTMGFYGQAMAYEKQMFESFGVEVILHSYLENVSSEIDLNSLKSQIDDLKIEIRKMMILTRNSRLSIPTVFF